MSDSSTEKETLVRKIADPGGGGTHGREAAKAQLEALLAGEVNQRLDQVSADIHQAQKILANRLTELNAELKAGREAMDRSSTEAAHLTKALVRWTRVSVLAMIVYTLLTAILAGVSLFGSPWAR